MRTGNETDVRKSKAKIRKGVDPRSVFLKTNNECLSGDKVEMLRM